MANQTTGDDNATPEMVLVARKAAFGLPTSCPSCLPVYLYLRLANAPFHLQFDRFYPDSGHVPYLELGDYVAFNNENGGVIEGLKEDGIVDLDSKLRNGSVADWCSTKAMICSWLADAVTYELWIASDGSAADKIYFSDLPWPIKKSLNWKQSRAARNYFGINEVDALEIEKEIYRRARLAYEALSLKLGEENFFFENRPTSVDALFLGHSLFVLQTSDDASTLKGLLVKHDNLLRYTESLKNDLLEGGSTSSIPRSHFKPSTSSMPKGTSTRWSSKSKPKAKKEKTEEEKTFKRRAKYFLAGQLIAVLVFLTVMGGAGNADMEMEDDDDESSYGY